VQVRDFEAGTRAMFIGYFVCYVPKAHQNNRCCNGLCWGKNKTPKKC